MRLKQIKGDFSVGRYEPETDFKPLFSRNFCSITRTATEVTIICEGDLLPLGFSLREDGWTCLQVDGEMKLTLSEILRKVSPSIPGAEVSLMFISTHDSDFVLTKAKTLERAKPALHRMGISVV